MVYDLCVPANWIFVMCVPQAEASHSFVLCLYCFVLFDLAEEGWWHLFLPASIMPNTYRSSPSLLCSSVFVTATNISHLIPMWKRQGEKHGKSSISFVKYDLQVFVWCVVEFAQKMSPQSKFHVKSAFITTFFILSLAVKLIRWISFYNDQL